MTKTQSVEPNIADLANGWLKSYKLNYKLEQESLNTEIDQALNDYYSKNGGVGGNRPDAKLLLQDKNLVNYPILIEYKGYKDKLVKLDSEGKVANKTAKNQPDFKNINSYCRKRRCSLCKRTFALHKLYRYNCHRYDRIQR